VSELTRNKNKRAETLHKHGESGVVEIRDTLDNGKLTLIVNKYVCLIKDDQIENDRKTINTCQSLLRILHPQTVRKIIPLKYAMHHTSNLGKGKIVFKLLRLQKRRKMNPTINTENPTSALDKRENRG